MRKKPSLNYESPALTAELQAPRALTREHPTANVQRPILREIPSLSRNLALALGNHHSNSNLVQGGNRQAETAKNIRKRVEAMELSTILDGVGVDKLDKIGRRTFGIDDAQTQTQ